MFLKWVVSIINSSTKGFMISHCIHCIPPQLHWAVRWIHLGWLCRRMNMMVAKLEILQLRWLNFICTSQMIILLMLVDMFVSYVWQWVALMTDSWQATSVSVDSSPIFSTLVSVLWDIRTRAINHHKQHTWTAVALYPANKRGSTQGAEGTSVPNLNQLC